MDQRRQPRRRRRAGQEAARGGVIPGDGGPERLVLRLGQQPHAHQPSGSRSWTPGTAYLMVYKACAAMGGLADSTCVNSTALTLPRCRGTWEGAGEAGKGQGHPFHRGCHSPGRSPWPLRLHNPTAGGMKAGIYTVTRESHTAGPPSRKPVKTMVLFPTTRKIPTKLLPRKHYKKGQKQACPQVLVTVGEGDKQGNLTLGKLAFSSPKRPLRPLPTPTAPFQGR